MGVAVEEDVCLVADEGVAVEHLRVEGVGRTPSGDTCAGDRVSDLRGRIMRQDERRHIGDLEDHRVGDRREHFREAQCRPPGLRIVVAADEVHVLVTDTPRD